MSWNTIKIDKADTLFSKYLRLKYKRCQCCGKRGAGDLGITGLQASHFWGRRMESVRYDLQNVDCLCIGCHKAFTDSKEQYREWKKEYLGEKEYDLLSLRANNYSKKDRKMEAIKWKLALKKDFNI